VTQTAEERAFQKEFEAAFPDSELYVGFELGSLRLDGWTGDPDELRKAADLLERMRAK
jgi:hypothetical protein